MDTTVNNPRSVTAQSPTTRTAQNAAPASVRAAAPEKTETPQAVPASDTVYKPALKQSARSSGLTTYKDEDSGRLIVRVYDRESGDVIVEFPPEKAFRPAAPAPGKPVPKPKKSLSV